jgi:hypothetical protein
MMPQLNQWFVDDAPTVAVEDKKKRDSLSETLYKVETSTEPANYLIRQNILWMSRVDYC